MLRKMPIAFRRPISTEAEPLGEGEVSNQD